MAADKKIAEFPDVENKLHAPAKKSLFERQKAEAEAKRQREEAENRAALREFEESFDGEEGNNISASGSYGGGGNFGGGAGGGFGGPPKRHYSSQPIGRNSGPGSLGPTPQARKRAFEGYNNDRGSRERGMLAFDDYEEDRERKFRHDEDEQESRREREEVAKPTLRLASLPPGTSPAVIKALLPANLIVDAVRMLPPTAPGVHSERRSMSAIVTLVKDTAANDIDAAVNSLQNRYLGYGYYLNLHRHLSSAAITNAASVPALGSSVASQPFGAKPVEIASAGRGHAPPPHQRGGFAPPSSYGPGGPSQLGRAGPLLHVPVQAPKDIKELKLIHKTIESLLRHGPEFEALLMSRPDVQREEKWAWLWDSRSTGGVWYRWRLWETLTGHTTKRGQGKYLPLFEDSSAWKAPDQPLAFEYTTRLDEIISESEYNSSDEEESGDESARRPQETGGILDDGKAYLNPLEKAKLTHLLARLPTSTGQLRKGDVARVTAFAISHAGRGADEVVAMIISNIEKPFAYTSANPDHKSKTKQEESEEEDTDNDTSSASLIGVYLISDILSSSSTSGVRHAWRYRQLFEAALKDRNVFEGLGRMETKMKWGRLRAEKWKRSVQMILGLWEGWCVFPADSQEAFRKGFEEPPMTAAEEAEAKRKEEEEQAAKSKSKWKAVEIAPKQNAAQVEEREEDVDGEPMEEDADVDGEPMEDEDVDGVPMDEDEEDVDGAPMEDDASVTETPKELEKKVESKDGPPPAGAQRRRPRAVDMFADSDDEDD